MIENYQWNDCMQFAFIQSTLVVGSGTGNLWNDCVQVQFLMPLQMPVSGKGFFAI